MKKLSTKILAFLLLLSLCLAFASCTSNDNSDSKMSATYVEIEINPAIELTVGEDGNIVSVYGVNDDAKILLYEEEANIVGKKYEEAISHITELAIALGYLSEENPDFNTTVLSGDASTAESVKSKIDAKIIATADGLGLTVTSNLEDAFTFIAELEKFKAQYPDNEKIQALTPAKYKLVLSASNSGEITLEAAAELSDEALISEVKKAHSVMKSYATDAYMKAKAKATAIFESAMGVLSDGIYTTVYASRITSILTNPSYLKTFHYGASYQAYKTTARTYTAVLEIMRFADEYTSLELPTEAVNEIAAALGITDTSPLKDENGKITLQSVKDYCNEFMRNNQVSENFRKTVSEAIASAENAAELVALASDAYNNELNALKLGIQNVITSVSSIASTVLPVLPADAKAEFEACLADLNKAYENITRIIESGDISDSVEILSKESEEKAAKMLDKINADLTDSEKATVAAMQAELDSAAQKLTEEFNSRLAAAEAEAKKYLSDMHAQKAN